MGTPRNTHSGARSSRSAPGTPRAFTAPAGAARGPGLPAAGAPGGHSRWGSAMLATALLERDMKRAATTEAAEFAASEIHEAASVVAARFIGALNSPRLVLPPKLRNLPQKLRKTESQVEREEEQKELDVAANK